jgi:hypothetical protein
MKIILRRITEYSSKAEIINFLKPILKGNFIQKTGKITRIKILALQDTKTNEIEYHGLVTIDSDEAAIRVIKKLNRKSFNKKRIIIREFFHRRWTNDPRNKMHSKNDQPGNRRFINRRRSTLEKISGRNIKYSSVQSFHRNYQQFG